MAINLLDPEKVKVVALDVGIKYTGICFFSQGTYIRSRTLTNIDPYKASAPVNAFKLIQFELFHISNNVNDEVVVVVEDYGYGGGYFKVEQAEIVGQLKLYIVNNRQFKYVPIPPNTVKKQVTGKGRATKSQMGKAIKSLGFATGSTHEADSLAVYLAYKSLWTKPTESMLSRCINLR